LVHILVYINQLIKFALLTQSISQPKAASGSWPGCPYGLGFLKKKRSSSSLALTKKEPYKLYYIIKNLSIIEIWFFAQLLLRHRDPHKGAAGHTGRRLW